MVVVPEFLIKRVYQKGSLKKTEEGVTLELKNILGPGVISGFNFVQINDVVFEPKDVKFVYNGEVLQGDVISEANPIPFRLGQTGKIILCGKDCLVNGTNKIVIEIVNPEVGKAQLKVEDNYNC